MVDDNLFLDDTEHEIEEPEEDSRGPLVGQFPAYITAAVIDPSYIAKSSGKKQTKIWLTWQICPNPDDQGWGKQKVPEWLYSAGMFKCNEVFKAVELPYKEHPTEKYKNGKPKRIWRLSAANLVGRGCLLELSKPATSKYSEIVGHYNVPGMKVLSPDEIEEMFIEDVDDSFSEEEQNTQDNVPF